MGVGGPCVSVKGTCGVKGPLKTRRKGMLTFVSGGWLVSLSRSSLKADIKKHG